MATDAERGPRGERGLTGPAGPSSASSVVLLTRAFEDVAKAIHYDRRDRRWLAAVVAMVLVVGLLVITDGRNQAHRNGQVLGVILAVTGCDVDDLAACSRIMVNASRAEGNRRIVEVDCAARRLAAGLPAPEQGRPCVEQTPPEVYPGRPPPG